MTVPKKNTEETIPIVNETAQNALESDKERSYLGKKAFHNSVER